MPNKDWTGPNWQWPKTWRGVWNCKNVLEKDELEEELLEKENTNCINQNVWQWQWFWRWQWRRCCWK